jgi:hypothetical protein
VACAPSGPDGRRVVTHEVMTTNAYATVDLTIRADAGT